MGSQIRMGNEIITIDERYEPGFAEHRLHIPSRHSALNDPPHDEPSFVKPRPQYNGDHHGSTVIDWPDISVQRRINKTEAGAPWKQFTERFDHATRRFGRATDFGKLAVEYFSAEEFSGMLSQKYPEVARDPDSGRAKRKAREIVRRLNESMQTMSGIQARVQDLEFADDLPTYWQPTSMEVDVRLDGSGPRKSVLPLIDEEGIFYKERQDSAGILKGFGFNVSMLDPDWKPEVVVLINDADLPARKTSYKTPQYPLTMPFDAPHAYITS